MVFVHRFEWWFALELLEQAAQDNARSNLKQIVPLFTDTANESWRSKISSDVVLQSTLDTLRQVCSRV